MNVVIQSFNDSNWIDDPYCRFPADDCGQNMFLTLIKGDGDLALLSAISMDTAWNRLALDPSLPFEQYDKLARERLCELAWKLRADLYPKRISQNEVPK